MVKHTAERQRAEREREREREREISYTAVISNVKIP